MGRIRTIKPEFGTNEQLGMCSPFARIAAALLPCHADREGRLEDRPMRLKVQILPYDKCDMSAVLDELAKIGFIVRYEADGLKLIQVVNFSKHQRPNIKEPASTLPHVPTRASTEKISQTDPVSIPVPVPNPVPDLIPDPEKSKYSARFLQFWIIYPRKDGKDPASKAFEKLSPPEQELVIADIPLRLKANWSDPKLILPHAATYLNQRRWEDELMPANGRASPDGPNLIPKRRNLFDRIEILQRSENASVRSDQDPAQSISHLAAPIDGRRGAG